MQSITLLFLLAFNLNFHPIHISITNISYLKDKNQFDVSVRLFRDDLEMIINHKYDQNILLTDNTILEDEATSVNKYISDMLIFMVNEDTLSIEDLTIEIDDLMIVSKFRMKITGSISSLEIKNILMMDAFHDQKNLLIINYNKNEKGYQFTIDDYQQKIVL